MHMEINSTPGGASIYAMKKAMDMPNLLLSLVRQTADSGKLTPNATPPDPPRALDLAAMTGKGKIIDIVA